MAEYSFTGTTRRMVQNLFDSSGMTLYYTSNLSLLRPNNGILLTGQIDLLIPPRQPNVTFEGTCTQGCTKYMQPTTLNIVFLVLHMHLPGNSSVVEISIN